jgi:hypothetical protein
VRSEKGEEESAAAAAAEWELLFFDTLSEASVLALRISSPVQQGHESSSGAHRVCAGKETDVMREEKKKGNRFSL